jgi:ATP-binding cassette subfamily B protein
VLTDFNLRIRRGECIALVGETGGGKSTSRNCSAGFYEPTEGSIRIDGVDYRKRSLHWLQSSLGIVLQEPHLFSGTIRENIRYGRLNATDSEIDCVADQVGVTKFIAGFPMDTRRRLAEGGNRLSTGQKQLVALARALLADPQILVLDEATSSVDTETEQQIQAAIEVVLKGRISLVIAHRLSTIRAANRILVIDHGRISEKELTRNCCAAKKGRLRSALYPAVPVGNVIGDDCLLPSREEGSVIACLPDDARGGSNECFECILKVRHWNPPRTPSRLLARHCLS